MDNFLAQHTIWDTIVIFWVVSAAVNALPEPSENASAFYTWLYIFLTTLVGHLSDAIHHRRQTTPQPSTSTTKEKSS